MKIICQQRSIQLGSFPRSNNEASFARNQFKHRCIFLRFVKVRRHFKLRFYKECTFGGKWKRRDF